MKSLSCVALICALLLLVSYSYATVLRSGNSIDYPESRPITDDILAAGNQINIDPEVKGDVIAAGQSVTLSGPVEDSVMLAGNSVAVSGSIGNDAWMAGQNVTLASPVADNAYIAGSNVRLTDRASVGTDLLAAGQTLAIQGNIRRNARLAGNNITISGTVGGNVYAKSNGRIRILDGAVIRGNLFYESPNEASIASGARILGRTERSIPPRERAKPLFWSKILFWFLSLLASIVFGAVFIALFPHFSQQTADTIRHSIWASLGIGFILLILLPFVLFLIGMTIIGIPLAIAALALYLILLYAARIPVAIRIGQWILGRGRQSLPSQYTSMVLGLVIIYLIGLIPILGGLVKLIVAAVGLGAFAITAWKARKSQEVVQGA